jgi:hypothetical protein
MAQEILELRRRIIPGGTLLAFEVLFLYPVDPPVILNGQAYPLTPARGPRASLPADIIAYGLLTTEELDELDAGTLAYQIPRPVEQKPDETLPQILARVRRAYVIRAAFIPQARAEFANTGTRHNR